MPDESECLSEAAVLELVQGGLKGTAMSAAEKHIAACGECRQLVSILARSSTAEGLERFAPPSEPSDPASPYDPTVASGPSGPSDGGDRLRGRESVRSKRDSLPVHEGDLLAAKYRVERVLGSGGMGVVVAATHIQLGQRVALKFLLPDACETDGAVVRFLREARAAVQIQSEHVARVVDVGTLESGAPFMVMEFLRGSDLAELLKSRGALPVDEAIDYVLQACEAIAEAHRLGIVHRDLKPANLFLTSRPDGTPFVKVLDFGISKVSAKELAPSAGITSAETMMGSPRYMSPEQMRSAKSVDARTDVWALGVVLYELVTAKPPFESETFAGLCGVIQTAAAPRLRDALPTASPKLEEVILRCLEKEPTKRLPSVAALAEALAPIAPARAQLSIQRIVRLLGASAPPAPLADENELASRVGAAAAKAAAEGMSSTGGFGRTHPSKRPAPVRALSAVGAVVIVTAAIAFGLYTRRTRDDAPPAVSTPLTALSPAAAASVVAPPARTSTEPASPAPPTEASGPARSTASPALRGPPRAAKPSSPRPGAPPSAAPSSPAPSPTPSARDTHQSGLFDRK